MTEGARTEVERSYEEFPPSNCFLANKQFISANFLIQKAEKLLNVEELTFPAEGTHH